MGLNFIWPLTVTTTRCSRVKKNAPTTVRPNEPNTKEHTATFGGEFQNKTGRNTYIVA